MSGGEGDQCWNMRSFALDWHVSRNRTCSVSRNRCQEKLYGHSEVKQTWTSQCLVRFKVRKKNV